MEAYDVIVNQPVVIDNVSFLSLFLTNKTRHSFDIHDDYMHNLPIPYIHEPSTSYHPII